MEICETNLLACPSGSQGAVCETMFEDNQIRKDYHEGLRCVPEAADAGAGDAGTSDGGGGGGKPRGGCAAGGRDPSSGGSLSLLFAVTLARLRRRS